LYNILYSSILTSGSSFLSAFGTILDNRNFGNSPRVGFNGQEKDNEISGDGNSISYTYRMLDTRLGRFFSVDPLADQYCWNSSYSFSSNRVIDAFEIEGLEANPMNWFAEGLSQWEAAFADLFTFSWWKSESDEVKTEVEMQVKDKKVTGTYTESTTTTNKSSWSGGDYFRSHGSAPAVTTVTTKEDTKSTTVSTEAVINNKTTSASQSKSTTTTTTTQGSSTDTKTTSTQAAEVTVAHPVYPPYVSVTTKETSNGTSTYAVKGGVKASVGPAWMNVSADVNEQAYVKTSKDKKPVVGYMIEAQVTVKSSTKVEVQKGPYKAKVTYTKKYSAGASVGVQTPEVKR